MFVEKDAMREILQRLAKPDPPKLQELVFRKRYLPMFTANIADGTPKKNMVPISIWLEIALSPTMPVDIMEGEKFLFRVPPLFDPADEVLVEFQNLDIYQIVRMAEKRYQTIPALGEQYIQHHLVNRVKSKKISMDYARMWNIILAHYKLPLIPLPDTLSKVKEEEQKVQKGIEGINFDEFEDF